MIIIAAYIWMVANIICMLILAWIGRKTRKVYHIMYVIFHLLCALWGMTVPSVNVPVIRDINAVILPLLGSVAALVGLFFRLKEVLKFNK